MGARLTFVCGRGLSTILVNREGEKSLRVRHEGTAVVEIKENPFQKRFQADPYGESQAPR